MEVQLSSQILTFETLQEFIQFIDNTIENQKFELSRYEEELGKMLRQTTQNGAEEEFAKQLQDKLSHKDKPPNSKEKKNGKKVKTEEKPKKNVNWRNYKDIQIFTGNVNQGKTEVYFEAVNELKTTIEKLQRIKEVLMEFTNIGLGNVLYFVYTKNGIPIRLVLLPHTTQEDKFEFKADFVTENMETPIESREV